LSSRGLIHDGYDNSSYNDNKHNDSNNPTVTKLFDIYSKRQQDYYKDSGQHRSKTGSLLNEEVSILLRSLPLLALVFSLPILIYELFLQFTSLLLAIEASYHALPKHYKIRIERWIRKLSAPMPTIAWRRNRNGYATLLLECVRKGDFREPFHKSPEEGPVKMLGGDIKVRAELAGKRVTKSFWKGIHRKVREYSERENDDMDSVSEKMGEDGFRGVDESNDFEDDGVYDGDLGSDKVFYDDDHHHHHHHHHHRDHHHHHDHHDGGNFDETDANIDNHHDNKHDQEEKIGAGNDGDIDNDNNNDNNIIYNSNSSNKSRNSNISNYTDNDNDNDNDNNNDNDNDNDNDNNNDNDEIVMIQGENDAVKNSNIVDAEAQTSDM